LDEKSLGDADSTSVSDERSQSSMLVVVWRDLEQTRQRLGVNAPASTTHVAGRGVGSQQETDDVSGRQRLVKLTQEDVDVQATLAVQQADLIRQQ